MLVKEIQAEGRVSGFYLIMDSQLRTAKNGTLYATLRLADKTGEIAMKVWELSTEVFNELKIGRVIKVEATAKIFNGVLQLEASGKDDFFRVCQENQYDPALFLRATDLELDRSGPSWTSPRRGAYLLLSSPATHFFPMKNSEKNLKPPSRSSPPPCTLAGFWNIR